MRDDINSTKMERHQHLQLFLDLKKKIIVHSADSISYFAMRDDINSEKNKEIKTSICFLISPWSQKTPTDSRFLNSLCEMPLNKRHNYLFVFYFGPKSDCGHRVFPWFKKKKWNSGANFKQEGHHYIILYSLFSELRTKTFPWCNKWETIQPKLQTEWNSLHHKENRSD